MNMLFCRHIVYSVKTEPLGYTVRRRYNDFAWLRDTLCAGYVGLFIPSIPSTTFFTTKTNLTGIKTDISGDFVKNRMAQLNQFMQQICKIPFLRTDPSLVAFISIQNEKEFKHFMDIPRSTTDSDGEGMKLWLQLVDKTVINSHDADRLIADFKRQLDILRATLDHVDKECRMAGKKAVQCAAAMSVLADNMCTWSDTESDLLDPNRNEHINAHGGKLKVYITALASGQSGWAQNVAVSFCECGFYYYSPFCAHSANSESYRTCFAQQHSVPARSSRGLSTAFATERSLHARFGASRA